MAGATTRQRYLDSVVQTMLDTGRTDLPLVALAEAAGTSDRMLVYYFKTRTALLTEAVKTIRARRRKQLTQALAEVPNSRPVSDGLRHALRWLTGEENAGATRLFYDAAGRGFHDEVPFRDFLEGSIQDSIEEASLTARRLGAEDPEARTFATMFSALATSLACDRQVTGDHQRVDRAIDAAAGALALSLGLPV